MDIGWRALDTYFKTNKYFVTQHHLDSYNYFVTKRIQQIIQSFRSVNVIKTDPANPNEIKHQIDVYVGGEDYDRLYFDKPTIVDPETRAQRLLLPNEARMFNYDYVSDLYADIVLKFTYRGDEKSAKIKTLGRVKVGSIPIMLHSKLCALNDQPFEVRREMGECPFDQGGYFIIGGKEKVCVAQERNVTNALFIEKKENAKPHTYEAFIRCTSEESSVFPKTVRLYVIGDMVVNDKLATNAIEISVPNVAGTLPLFVLYRILGVESDKEIIESIISFETDRKIKDDMIEFLSVSAMASSYIYSQKMAAGYAKKRVELGTIENLYYIIGRDLFPNLEKADLDRKARYLSYIVNQLVRVCLGLASPTDRDSYMYKRVGISGFLLGDIFKDYYNAFRVAFRSKIDNVYEYRKNELGGREDIRDFFGSEMFTDSIITSGLMKSLKGSWGLKNVQGISQDLNRVSYIGFLSHLRRVNLPIDATLKIRAPRRLVTSQYGMVCPSESPDGGSIGLLKNFSIMCMVSFDVPTECIKKALEPFNIIYHANMTPEHKNDATFISINNTWVGVIGDAQVPKMVRWIRLLRRNSLINNLVSISWDIFKKKVNILTDNGRCLRPLFVVDEKSKTLSLSKKEEKKKVWHDYIRGSTLAENEYSFYFNDYHDAFKRFPGKNIDEIMDILEKNAAVMEYVDVEETNNSMIAMYPQDLAGNANYTHCEIHPSTMFSIYTVTIPFANHNAAPRLAFSGAQGKQAIGCYATNFNNRIDTMGYVLHYPQRPLVKTRFNDYLNTTQLPNGENLIVAVCTYTGYNQEDSVIINKRSLERGMFNVSYYKCYNAEESADSETGERVIFTNKNMLLAKGESFDIKAARYDKLDDNGLPIVGKRIKENDAYLGMFNVKDEGGDGGNGSKKVYADKTLVADKTMSGTVDKVVMFTNKSGNREVKIRVRKFRVPELGDKVASRYSQKGVCGMILPAEDMPFTNDGMVPDIIINPHAFPTRMTVGHLMECIMAKACVVKGCEYDAVAFEKHDLESFHGDLHKFGLQKHGDEVMYNGRSGEMMNTEIFIGPTFYQRLKHMVADKVNYRTTGKITGLTKQPTKGRSNQGGLRIGEMETNAILGHGMSAFIKESFFERSDKYEFYMDREQNTVGGRNPFNKRIMSPYAFKLLIQELQIMGIDPRLITDSELDELAAKEEEYDGIDFGLEGDDSDEEDLGL